jgi:hypothetical protein
MLSAFNPSFSLEESHRTVKVIICLHTCQGKESAAKTAATTRPVEFFTVMLKKYLSCYRETRHVGKNARHVKENTAMLAEMPAMLEILLSC